MNCNPLVRLRSAKPFPSRALSIIIPPPGMRGYIGPKPRKRSNHIKKDGNVDGKAKLSPGEEEGWILRRIRQDYADKLAKAAKEPWFFTRWRLRFKAFKEYEAYDKDHVLHAHWYKSRTKEISNKRTEYRRCQRIIEKLNEQLREEKRWKVHVKSEEFKGIARAHSDRTIEIGELCVRKCRDDDMLAFVLAHEMSHILHQHFEKRLRLDLKTKRRVALHILLCSVSSYYNEEKTRNSMRKKFIEPLSLQFNKRQRKSEYEADALALGIMMRAGMNPQGAIDFLTTMDPNYIERDLKMTEEQLLWRFHPKTTDRIQAIRKIIRKEQEKEMKARAYLQKPTTHPRQASVEMSPSVGLASKEKLGV